jgi:SagB-type dehydrogenase family enzyme
MATVTGTASHAAVALPLPAHEGHSLESALARRRTVRSFKPAPISLADVGQLLWAAQGVTDPEGLRTAPSAGALYPLETFVVAARVDGLAPGVYRYGPSRHRLAPVIGGDRIGALVHAALDQRWIAPAAAVLVIAAVPGRTTAKYRARGVQYVHMEAGHAAQNVLLQAAALGLAAAPVGAFDDRGVHEALSLPPEAEPLYLLPLGHPR